MSRVIRTGEHKITNGYAAHTGWSKGVDIVKKLSNGTYTIDDVIAHSDGTVIKVVDYMTGTNGKLDREAMGYGNYVMILHNNKYQNKYVVTLYAHLAKVDSKIKEGVIVAKGQVLGVIGNTGNSFGAHLHHEIRLFDNKPVYTALHNTELFGWIDPTPYLDTDLPTDKKTLTVTSYKDYLPAENKYYRVRKAFNDSKSSKGSFRKFSGAFTTWKSYSAYGYHIYDNDGKQLD